MGVRFKASHFTRRYGLAEDEFTLEGTGEDGGGGEDEAEGSAPAPGAGAEFAEGDEPLDAGDAQGDIDRALDAVLGEAAAANAKLARDIQEAVERAENPEDAMLLLAELLGGEAQTSELEDLLTRVMVGAAMRGRAAVREEVDRG